MTFEDDYVPSSGWVAITQSWPGADGPTRFGEWIVMIDGTFTWVESPPPPFPVLYHEGKLKNSDTMVEISIETLPGNIATRLAALEAAASQPVP